jgi:large repetitive protein
MRKKLILLTIAFGLFGLESTNAQDAPTAAPEVKGFSLSPDNVGAAANSVNLYTGDLHLPINLVSLPGRNGLDVNVSIAYSSNVQNQVDTWNLEAPTGILGLGWNMDIPKIVVDTKQTGTREDDNYYLIEGGSSNKLIRTTSGSDATGGYFVYETKNYQFWKIKFYYDITEAIGSSIYNWPNKWEIIKENGFKYIYGDKNSGRRTLQYIVRWENWIGNSSQTTGQSQMVSAWNLSEIVNLQGEKVLFEYDNEEQYVGNASGQKHTEASYLKQITDPIGRKVQFVYLPKLSSYYMEPHTEQAEPDAYQEVYEKKYLDHIDVIRETGVKQLFVNFQYGSINSGTNTAKMLLSRIEQRNAVGNALPGTSFDYYTATDANGYKGFLQKITYPTGGTTSYKYKMDGNFLGHSMRNLNIPAHAIDPDGPYGYAEPLLWFGQDYVVVTWRALGSGGSHLTGASTVKIYVYQWVGEWKKSFLQTITGVTATFDGVDFNGNPVPLDASHYENFQVVLEDNFFAVLQGNNLFIWNKKESARGDWIGYTRTNDYGAGKPTLMSGNNFVAVGSYQDDSTHPCHLYTFQGDKPGYYLVENWKDNILNQTIGDHFYTSANNYFIS